MTEAWRDLAERVARLPWSALSEALETRGIAQSEPLLDADECRHLVELAQQPSLFRSHVDMAQHGYGRGSYSYFADPLPLPVEQLRRELYSHLQPLANGLLERLGNAHRYPPSLEQYRELCARAGQTKPTPLLLRYGRGDYNRLHRDLYGELRFPLQVAVMLSRPGVDYEGGEMLFVEQRPRQQARGHAIIAPQGGLVIFPVSERPIQGKRGFVRVSMRHGVSEVRSGQRYVLGVIFHDAQ